MKLGRIWVERERSCVVEVRILDEDEKLRSFDNRRKDQTSSAHTARRIKTVFIKANRTLQTNACAQKMLAHFCDCQNSLIFVSIK